VKLSEVEGMLKPKACIICSVIFQPKTSLSKICGKKECNRELDRRRNEKKAQEKYKHGKVFTLDMSLPESEWTWTEENRGD